ncbi:5'-nucleotidase [Parasphingorhabdus flavimaris]|uniref:5'-nucleotidase n=1 Tax=Parasphingorhabdus flavimaris TaxID=266812 RepID=UPI003002CC33
MAFPINEKLVVAVSSTALFDLTEEHRIFEEEGEAAFKNYQIERKDHPPGPGVAYPFIRRLLHLNKIFPNQMPVEVVILSRNDPEAGVRIMNSAKAHELDITRGVFLSGKPPYPYMPSFNASLYLSTNRQEVRDAVVAGHPAGFVLPTMVRDDDINDLQLRLAFDFDGVLVDDEAESKFADGGLPLFHHYEAENKERPLKDGPLMPLLQKLSKIQELEQIGEARKNSSEKVIRVSIVTARNAPAHERMINTMKNLDIEVDELFLTGGIEKKNFLDIIQPQMFFDDQLNHLEPAAENTPCVHIPFGVRNEG